MQAATATRVGCIVGVYIVNLPDTLSLGVYQRLSPQLALTGDLTWTNWSDFQELRISYDSPQPDTVVPETAAR